MLFRWTIALACFTLLLFSRDCLADLSPAAIQRGKQATVLLERDGQQRYGTAFCVASAGLFVTTLRLAESPQGSGTLTLVQSPGEKNQKRLSSPA